MPNNIENLITAKHIETLIASVAAAEKITKKDLGILSRDLLTFIMVQKTYRIEFVNELVGKLSPMNKKTAVLYFKHFLPFHVVNNANGDFKEFGGMFDAGKKMEAKAEALTAFLENPMANIWTWAEENIAVDTVPDYAGRVTNAVKQALKGKGEDGEGALQPHELLQSVMAGGITGENILAMIDQIADAEKAAA